MSWASKLLLVIVVGLGSLLIRAPGASAATTPCKGPPPSVGAEVHGPVLDVVDGKTLCVALGPTPDRWVALKLAGAPPADLPNDRTDQARGALMAVAFARNVTCRVVAADKAGRSAVCVLDGRSIVVRMREHDAVSVGLAWR